MNDITTARLPPETADERYLSVRRVIVTGGRMSLKAQLDACRRAFEASTPPGIVPALEGSVAELAQTGLVRQALKAGERAPLFRLRSNTGDFVALSETLDRGPAVVSFFRGDWCPFCRLELQALAEAQSEIERLGATLIGLSPLPGAGSCPSFLILTDPGCRVAARYRIAFTVARRFRLAYLALGYPERLKKGRDHWVLPLPATYIVDRDGIVVLSYVDGDYTSRLEPTEIAVALSHLRARANPGSSD
jgi:peroxiredoxin